MPTEHEALLRMAANFLVRRPDATQDEIATAVGVSRTTLHRYFAGRSELFDALYSLALDQMREAIKVARLQEGSATESIRRLVNECQAVAPYLALLYSQSQRFDTDQVQADWEVIDAEITAVFRRGQEDGEFRLDLTPAWLADALDSLIAGTAWAIQAGRVAERDFVHVITELLLHGVTRT